MPADHHETARDPLARPDQPGRATRGLLLVLGLAATWVAVCAGLLPSATGWSLPWPVAPLHARCLAALHAAAALTWLSGLQQRDRAAVRIPLALALASSGVYVLQVLAGWPLLAPDGWAGWVWLLVQAAAAGLSAGLLFRQRELQAPAERLDAALGLSGGLALAAAALLATRPDWAARAWPWPLPRQPAVLYAAALAGWALALLMLARERRRAARRLTLLGLAVAGPLVAWASWLDWQVFHHGAQAAAWSAMFLGVSAMAWRRLSHPGLRHRRPANRRRRSSPP